jgi:hypothetical protein
MKRSKELAKKSEEEKLMLSKRDSENSDEVHLKKRELKADRKAANRAQF